MEPGVTLLPLSPPCVVSSQPRGMASLLTATLIGEHRSKHLRVEGGPPSGLFKQPPPARVTLDREGVEDPFVGAGEREMGSTPLRDVQQVLETSAAVATVSSSSLRESWPLPKKVCTKGCLPPSTWYVCVNVMSLFHSISPLVSELGIRWFLSRKHTLGALNFH
jgi:hypothetical protein